MGFCRHHYQPCVILQGWDVGKRKWRHRVFRRRRDCWPGEVDGCGWVTWSGNESRSEWRVERWSRWSVEFGQKIVTAWISCRQKQRQFNANRPRTTTSDMCVVSSYRSSTDTCRGSLNLCLLPIFSLYLPLLCFYSSRATDPGFAQGGRPWRARGPGKEGGWNLLDYFHTKKWPTV